ncbi:MAG: TPM domain-containing protein [Ottowia sp.]|uniref:TPM domain-containing protein n=1 Tax=Ottowia sp. TaxID=1898956 RepID=UPI0039E3FD9F
MFQTLARLLRHRWLDAADARRAVPPALAERLRRRVAASEQRHTGEVRICVEGGLPASYLWRHVRDRVPMPQVVRERALMMFSKLRVWDTEHNNGVLIYVLLAEHAIELVADRGIDRLVGPAGWQAMALHLGRAIAGGRVEDGLTQALEEVSAALVAHFPQAAGNAAPVNELPDEPVLR